MAIIQSRRARWDPFKEFRALDRRFSRFGWPFVAEKDDVWSPPIDVLEKDGEVIIKAELPGLTRDEVKVSLDEDSIVISGERKTESETKEEDYYISRAIVRLVLPAYSSAHPGRHKQGRRELRGWGAHREGPGREAGLAAPR